MASRDLGEFIGAKSVITWEQLLWGDAQLTIHGLYPCGVSEKLTRMNLSSAQKTQPTRDYDITAILRAWVALWNSVLWNILEPEQLGPGKCIRQRAPPGTMLRQNTRPLWPGKSRRYMAQLGLGLHTTPGILSSLDLGSSGDTGQPGTASLAQDGP